jgi:hypothetical protein
MSITPEPPLKTCEGRLKHGSILNGNISLPRVSSQWKSTIHGTNEAWSIGQSVSSGCIRLLNQDIIDLHARVPEGSKMVVLTAEQSGKGEFQ